MSATVYIHKCIRNGCIETVTCTCIQALFDAVRNNLLDHKRFIYERDFSIVFILWRKRGRYESTL